MLTKSKLKLTGLLTALALTGAVASVFAGAIPGPSGANAHPAGGQAKVNAEPESGQPSAGGSYWQALKANERPNQ